MALISKEKKRMRLKAKAAGEVKAGDELSPREQARMEKRAAKLVKKQERELKEAEKLKQAETAKLEQTEQGQAEMQKPRKAETGKPKQAEADSLQCRLITLGVMSLFLLFVLVWGVSQTVSMVSAGAADSEKEEVQDGKNAEETLDTQKLAQEILSEVKFDTKLAKLEDSVASGMISMEEGTGLQIYMGNGSSADELLIMTAKSESAARENLQHAEGHLSEMQTAIADYLPDQAKKIDSAVKVQSGCYVVVCVTADRDKAEQIIQDAL